MLQQEGRIRKAQGPTEIRMALTFSISLIGIGEIVLLPLDVLKIKRQTNPEAFRGRGVFRIVADEGMGLYRGAGWTAARNAPGSFAVRYSRSGRTFPTPSLSNSNPVISSSSAVLPLPNNTFTPSKTTTPRPGARTSLPPWQARQRPSLSPPRSTSSRPVSRTETSKTQSLASRS
jgi:hypothetical protein